MSSRRPYSSLCAVQQCRIRAAVYIDIIFASWFINVYEQKFSICLAFSRNSCVLK